MTFRGFLVVIGLNKVVESKERTASMKATRSIKCLVHWVTNSSTGNYQKLLQCVAGELLDSCFAAEPFISLCCLSQAEIVTPGFGTRLGSLPGHSWHWEGDHNAAVGEWAWAHEAVCPRQRVGQGSRKARPPQARAARALPLLPSVSHCLAWVRRGLCWQKANVLLWFLIKVFPLYVPYSHCFVISSNADVKEISLMADCVWKLAALSSMQRAVWMLSFPWCVLVSFEKWLNKFLMIFFPDIFMWSYYYYFSFCVGWSV